MVARAPPLVSSGGSAVRRRERRLRSFWRHEQMAIQMALATVTLHSFKVGTAHDVLRSQKPVMTAGGLRPPPLVEERPQVRIQQLTVELMIDVSPYVQILDAPVAQVEDHALEFFRRMDLPVAEQVIEVPKISRSPCPSRSPFPEPQSAEQLVEVPTMLSPTRIAVQIAEQIVDTPVLRGRGEGRVQGFLPRQSSTATPSAKERISERIVEQFVFTSSAKRTSERIEEQLVDTSPGVGLGQGSSSSAGPADEDFIGFFALFSVEKNAECRRESECGPAPARQLMDSGGL